MTKHNSTCKMAFGRPSKHTECPRCEELKAGSKPRAGWGNNRSIQAKIAQYDRIKHICSERCSQPICTFGEW